MALLSDLVVPVTTDEAEAKIIAICQALKLPVTSWQDGSFPKTVIAFAASFYSDFSVMVAQIAGGATLETALNASESSGTGIKSQWLDLKARSQYDDARKTATFTIGTFQLQDFGGGPHTITTGQVIVAGPGALRYRNLAPATLAANGTITLQFSAEASGAAYNLPANSTLSLVSSLPTVVVTNPALGTTGTWITAQGTDTETDRQLATRLKAKWGMLATGSPIAAYEYLALSQSGVTRARCDDKNPGGPGTVWVYVDSAAAVSALQLVYDAFAPAGTKATAVAATNQTVSIPGTIYVATSSRAAAEATVTANLTALALSIPIGGIVRKSDVYEAITTGLPNDNKSDFVLASTWAGAPDNIQLTSSAIPSFSLALNWIEV